jgi:hypothetical protein
MSATATTLKLPSSTHVYHTIQIEDWDPALDYTKKQADPADKHAFRQVSCFPLVSLDAIC